MSCEAGRTRRFQRRIKSQPFIRETGPGLRGGVERTRGKEHALRRFGPGPLQGKYFIKVKQGKNIWDLSFPQSLLYFELRKRGLRQGRFTTNRSAHRVPTPQIPEHIEHTGHMWEAGGMENVTQG